MPLQVVVFDLFETLVANGPELWIRSFERICTIQSLPIQPQSLWEPWINLEREFRRRRLDPVTLRPSDPFESYTEVWTDCFQKVFVELGLSGNATMATKICIEDLARRPLFGDTLDVLRKLEGTVQMAILSNADRSFMEPLLEFHGIRDKFSVTLCSEEAQAYKPHPSIFIQLLERIRVSPSKVIQVGDTLAEDVRGAKLVGMQAVWLNRNHANSNLPKPDYEIHDLNELLPILDRRIHPSAEARGSS